LEAQTNQRLGGKEPIMLIIGCDYHPGFQQIAFVDTETGEGGERRLVHREEAEQFYGELKQRRCAVRVGMEASGHSRWFERLLRDLEFELWIGDAAEIRTKRESRTAADGTFSFVMEAGCSIFELQNKLSAEFSGKQCEMDKGADCYALTR
jgi:hypothetical protein